MVVPSLAPCMDSKDWGAKMSQNKTNMVSLEEGGFAIFLVLLAFACIIVAGKTFDQVMAFHASVGALFAARRRVPTSSRITSMTAGRAIPAGTRW